MQPFPPHQSPSQQPERVSLVVKIIYFIASHPVQKLVWRTAACSHLEKRAARSQLSARPIHRADILDFTVSLHSLKIIDRNARLIKQSSQINVLDINTSATSFAPANTQPLLILLSPANPIIAII